MLREERAIQILEQRACCRECVVKNCACAECDEAFDMAIKALKQEPKWIPVSERLPEENKTVMASTEFGVFPEARYSKEYGWEWAYESGADYWRSLEDTGDTVTAWMPLPKKYEPQESEEA